jgi:hypothetical protein
MFQTPVSFKQKFKRDLARGSLFEDFIADYFRERGWTIKRATGLTPAYDLVLTRRRTTIMVEVKYDAMSDATGNYCLERKSLLQTQSAYLIIGTPQEAYTLPMNEARKLYNEYPKRQTGDFQSNISALIPKTVFSKFQSLN